MSVYYDLSFEADLIRQCNGRVSYIHFSLLGGSQYLGSLLVTAVYMPSKDDHELLKDLLRAMIPMSFWETLTSTYCDQQS